MTTRDTIKLIGNYCDRVDCNNCVLRDNKACYLKMKFNEIPNDKELDIALKLIKRSDEVTVDEIKAEKEKVMREILFRGKNTDTGEWLYGELTTLKDGNKEALYIYGKGKIEPTTIGEFTGMHDDNGKRIFEGDILQFSYVGKYLGVEGVADVVFQNGKFGVLWGYRKELVCVDGFSNTTIEVVGNIFDNPDLLEKEKL